MNVRDEDSQKDHLILSVRDFTIQRKIILLELNDIPKSNRRLP